MLRAVCTALLLLVLGGCGGGGAADGATVDLDPPAQGACRVLGPTDLGRPSNATRPSTARAATPRRRSGRPLPRRGRRGGAPTTAGSGPTCRPALPVRLRAVPRRRREPGDALDDDLGVVPGERSGVVAGCPVVALRRGRRRRAVRGVPDPSRDGREGCCAAGPTTAGRSARRPEGGRLGQDPLRRQHTWRAVTTIVLGGPATPSWVRRPSRPHPRLLLRLGRAPGWTIPSTTTTATRTSTGPSGRPATAGRSAGRGRPSEAHARVGALAGALSRLRGYVGGAGRLTRVRVGHAPRWPASGSASPTPAPSYPRRRRRRVLPPRRAAADPADQRSRPGALPEPAHRPDHLRRPAAHRGRRAPVAVDSAAVQRKLATTCPRRLAAFVGGSAQTRDLSRFNVVWFSPTLAQSDAGADWFRCDVMAFADERDAARAAAPGLAARGPRPPGRPGHLRPVRQRGTGHGRVRAGGLRAVALVAGVRDDPALRRAPLPRRGGGALGWRQHLQGPCAGPVAGLAEVPVRLGVADAGPVAARSALRLLLGARLSRPGSPPAGPWRAPSSTRTLPSRASPAGVRRPCPSRGRRP